MVNKMPAQAQRKRSICVVNSECSDHLVNNLDCTQSVRQLEEPFVIYVVKDGVSIVEHSTKEKFYNLCPEVFRRFQDYEAMVTVKFEKRISNPKVWSKEDNSVRRNKKRTIDGKECKSNQRWRILRSRTVLRRD